MTHCPSGELLLLALLSMTRNCTTGGGSIGRRSAVLQYPPSTHPTFTSRPTKKTHTSNQNRPKCHRQVHPVQQRRAIIPFQTKPKKKKEKRDMSTTPTQTDTRGEGEGWREIDSERHAPFVPTPHMRACFGSWRTVSSYSLSSYAMRADCGYLWCSRMYASVDYREGFTVLRKTCVCCFEVEQRGRVDGYRVYRDRE